MYYREANIDRDAALEVGPPPTRTTPVELVHRVLYDRSEVLRRENPGTWVEHDFDDKEPRAVLWLRRDGVVLAQEFIESGFSVGKPDRRAEYIEAALRYGRLAVHFPALTTDKEAAIRILSEVWVSIRDHDVQEKVSIQGFLYADDARTIQEI